jgi:hypothetical protein
MSYPYAELHWTSLLTFQIEINYLTLAEADLLITREPEFLNRAGITDFVRVQYRGYARSYLAYFNRLAPMFTEGIKCLMKCSWSSTL